MPADTLTGSIEDVVYYNDETGYSVVRVAADGKLPPGFADGAGNVTVVGIMPELNAGETVEFTGEWVNDPRWGQQFRAQTAVPSTPLGAQGLMRYLAGLKVTGLGEGRAERIVKHFGEQTRHVLDVTPERLHEVPGLPIAVVRELETRWRQAGAEREAFIFLQGYGVSARMASKIIREYGERTVAVVKDQPYRLADDVHGIGFIKADAIARAMGMPPDAPQRLRAGLLYALGQMAQDGHTFAPRGRLLATAAELLGVEDDTLLEDALQAQVRDGRLVADKMPVGAETVPVYYLPDYYKYETGAALRLRELAAQTSAIIESSRSIEWVSFLGELADKNAVQLSDVQQSAVRAALTHKVSVLTGGPGTGKTTTLRMVINALQARHFVFALASPTGRAAKRLTEATGHSAYTIHRLLGFRDGGFEFNDESPLEVDMVVVDESSMIDVELFYHLLRAIPDDAHLLLVGDVDQLPSVGAGNVLHDVIDSKVAHVTRLHDIYRQNPNSYIAYNAGRINEGAIPVLEKDSQDFFFFKLDDPQEAADMVVDVVVNRIPAKFSGIDPLRDVQVIAPMYRGAAGVQMLNDRLQARLNGGSHLAQIKRGGRVFRVGDKVMQTRNDYEKDVFNGDIGRVDRIDLEDQLLYVRFDEQRVVDYGRDETDDLMHAYCISTHRSQGSEYPVVVFVILTQHYMMLQRNLVYTAITRAKKIAVLVGSPKALAMAVKNNQVAQRFSGLLARLKE